MVLFNMLYKMVLTFESVDEVLKCDFSMVLFITFNRTVLTYGPVGGMFKFDQVRAF